MRVTLEKNLQALRKARKITQEQLAEAMNVSIAAVSKWETGASRPDMELLPELASFYDVSIDALMGYTQSAHSASEIAAQMHEHRESHRYDEGIRMGQAAMQKYPGDFKLTNEMASLWFMKGVSEMPETGDNPALRQAIPLFQQAIRLFEQNTDPKTTKEDMYSTIASAWCMLGETEKGIALMEKQNHGGYYAERIGSMYLQAGQVEKAREKLEEAMGTSVFQLFSAAFSLSECYDRCGQKEEAEAMLHLTTGLMESVTREDEPGYGHRLLAVLYANQFVELRRRGRLDEAARAAEKATRHAISFDRDPRFTINSLRFCAHAIGTFADSLGEGTCLKNVQQMMEEEE